MGFHKRHIDKEKVISFYERDGINGLKQLFSADALIVHDNIDTDKIVEYLTNDDEESLKKCVEEIKSDLSVE